MVHEAVAALVERGGSREELIQGLSKLVQNVSLPDEARIDGRLARAGAYVARAEELRARPADAAPLFGIDSHSLLELALRDANEVLKIVPSCMEAHLIRCKVASINNPQSLQGFILDALSIDPSNAEVKKFSAANAFETPAQKGSVLSLLECCLCTHLFVDPVTTSCGHTFCRSCLLASMDHSQGGSQRCPYCRTPQHIEAAAHPVTHVIQSLIETAFPEELRARRQELQCIGQRDGGPNDASSRTVHTMPVFVLGMVFPGHVIGLNVFEPRYRLMIRRCLEGNSHFILASADEGGRPDESKAACTMRIIDSRIMPDGRIGIQCRAERRVKLQSVWEVDGYFVAHAAEVSDRPLDSYSVEDQAYIQATVKECVAAVTSHSQYKPSDLPVPQQTDDVELMSLWLSSIFARNERGGSLHPLETTDTKERLEMVQAAKAQRSGCTIC